MLIFGLPAIYVQAFQSNENTKKRALNCFCYFSCRLNVFKKTFYLTKISFECQQIGDTIKSPHAHSYRRHTKDAQKLKHDTLLIFS